jgi:hypothetical protein
MYGISSTFYSRRYPHCPAAALRTESNDYGLRGCVRVGQKECDCDGNALYCTASAPSRKRRCYAGDLQSSDAHKFCLELSLNGLRAGQDIYINRHF